jgi:hypothetical protein
LFTLAEIGFDSKLGTIKDHKKAGMNGQLIKSLKAKYLTCALSTVFGCLFGFDGTKDSKKISMLEKAGGDDSDLGMTLLWLLKVAYKRFNSAAWFHPLGEDGESSINSMATAVLKDRLYNGFIAPIKAHGVWGATTVAHKIGNGFDETRDVNCTKGVYFPFVLFLAKTNTQVRDEVQKLANKYESGQQSVFQYLTDAERNSLLDHNNAMGTAAYTSITPQKRAAGRWMD